MEILPKILQNRCKYEQKNLQWLKQAFLKRNELSYLYDTINT